MARSLLLLAALTVFLTACNKTDDTTSPEEMLRGGQWKRTSLKGSHKDPVTGIPTITDGFASMPDCVKDNGLEFKTNYIGSEHRNNKCNAGDADEAAFQWEVYNSGKNIRIYNAVETFGTSDIDAEILNISTSQISLRYKYIVQDASQVNPTDTVTVTDVFRK